MTTTYPTWKIRTEASKEPEGELWGEKRVANPDSGYPFGESTGLLTSHTCVHRGMAGGTRRGQADPLHFHLVRPRLRKPRVPGKQWAGMLNHEENISEIAQFSSSLSWQLRPSEASVWGRSPAHFPVSRAGGVGWPVGLYPLVWLSGLTSSLWALLHPAEACGAAFPGLAPSLLAEPLAHLILITAQQEPEDFPFPCENKQKPSC